MTPAARELPRVLGLWDATCVVIGAIVGVGIFFTPRGVADVTGSAAGALLAWGLGGAIALLGALTFAELGRLRPVAGGQYLILRDAFGRAPAFLFVFCNLTAVQAGAVAIIAIVCAQNLGVALHGAAPAAAWVLPIAAGLVAALAVVNVAGVRGGAGVQDATVVVKLLVFAALVAVALGVRAAPAAAAGPAAAVTPLRFAPLFTGVTLTLFAYGGWQQALWMAGETREAARTVPRAILLGVGVVVLAYLSANWAYLHLLGLAGVRRAPELAADAFSVASPNLGRRLAAGAVAVSAFGVLNAQLLSGPRLTWAMAREGQFFAPFARLLPRAGTPAAAILLLAGLGTALALGLGPARTDALTAGVVVVDATFFALTGLALPVLRRRAGRRAGWRDAAAVVFAALELLAIAGSLLERDVRPVALSAIGWMGAAGITWAVWFRRRGAPAAAPAGA
ncbi:MAG TPA: amino acid permease [Candidatus Eisenbacteria bacterium]|nr:amino acid permease [Candidatus Eisenbacteria bacterium]